MSDTLTLRSGKQVIATSCPVGLAPGQTGQHVGGERVWLAFPHLPDEWYETTCRTIHEIRGLASVADDLDELLSVAGLEPDGQP